MQGEVRAVSDKFAQKGGGYRWKGENEGFNRQKNSGSNLEHVSGTNPQKCKAYYLLLQIAVILVQLLERGSLLRRLADELGRPMWKLVGRRLACPLSSLKPNTQLPDRAPVAAFARVSLALSLLAVAPPIAKMASTVKRRGGPSPIADRWRGG
jgi:hypothetical protein